jgi:membrane fusion protein, copper/silver efflux system
MRTVTTILASAALIVVGLLGIGLGWLMFGGDRGGNGHATHDYTSAPAANAAAAQMYTCSMHPQFRSPNPNDKCPICGMDLIPVPADGDEDDDGDVPRLRLTRRAMALMQVQVHPAQRRAVQVPVRVYGRVGFDETRLQTIAAWAPGRLERLHVDFTGVSVRQGEPMVELFSPMLIAAQQELLQAIDTHRELAGGLDAVRDVTGQTVEAARDRLRLLGLGQQQIQSIEQQRRVEDRITIPAPVSGVVIERLAATGDYVETGQPIYRLADLSNLWVQLEVYEADLPWLALGQTATFTTQSHPGQPFEGTISFIDPMLNERTRTVRVRVDVPNPDGLLRPGMLVRGVVQTHAHQAEHTPDEHGEHVDDGLANNGQVPLLIPASAPLLTGQRAVVYVQVPDQDRPTFEPRDVVLGPRAGAWYIVREGLSAGDLVVTHGAFKIDSELQIRGRPSMMQPDGGAPPTHDHGTDAADAADPAREVEPLAAPDPFRQQLGALVLANFKLVAALADDDAQGARHAAASAHDALGRIDAGLLDDPAAAAWTPLAQSMQHALAAVTDAADLPNQRRQSEPFSNALIHAVRTLGVQQAGSVHLAMCPMVEGRRGYWLQADRTIANPYYGSAMLRCGEIVATLAEAHDHEGGRP